MGPCPAEPPWELLAALLTFQIGRDSRRPPPPTLQFSNLAGLETVFSTSRTPLKDKRKKKEKTDLRGVLLCGDICPPPREDGHGREGRGRRGDSRESSSLPPLSAWVSASVRQGGWGDVTQVPSF